MMKSCACRVLFSLFSYFLLLSPRFSLVFVLVRRDRFDFRPRVNSFQFISFFVDFFSSLVADPAWFFFLGCGHLSSGYVSGLISYLGIGGGIGVWVSAFDFGIGFGSAWAWVGIILALAYKL